MPVLNEHGLRGFHLALEAIFYDTLASIEIELGVSLALLHCGEGSNVLFGEGAERIFVDSTGEVEVEISTLVEALSIELLDLFVVSLVEVSECELCLAGVVAIEGAANRVAKCLLRILISVLLSVAMIFEHFAVIISVVHLLLET